MHVVTAGKAFIDIDAYGSAVALAELLRLQGDKAIAASSAPFNASVPESLRKLAVQFETNYKAEPNDVFTIVDLSDPEVLDFDATTENVVAIVDHHLGFEEFWRKRLGNKAHIEFIGAACTQVYEFWQTAKMLDKMSQDSAKLLACGILDNTLNLKAKITTQRDRDAYADLAKRANLPDNWPEQYFSECQAYILKNTKESVICDAKNLTFPTLPHKAYVGQLTLWNAKEFIEACRQTVRQALETGGKPWFMNFIDIHTGRSVLLCEDPTTKTWLEQTLDVRFDKDTATANRLWLRKEITQRATEKEDKQD